MPLIIAGQIAPMDAQDPTAVFAGKVYLTDDGFVAAVRATGQDSPVGFAQAREVDVGTSFVYPGLIDLHSHIGFNTLPLWAEPTQQVAFAHHDSWTRAKSYKPSVSWPAYLIASGAPEALLAYVQVRALAGGTTTIQGWPSQNRRPANKLVRSVDDDAPGPRSRDPVRVSTITLDVDQLRDRAELLSAGNGFVYHCGEGQRGSLAAREFDDVAIANCLRQNLIAIHLNAVDESAFRRWFDRAQLGGEPTPGTVVWSPFSNLWLYGQTTDIVAARKNNVTVCLGTDWGPSGTKNLLGEIKVAHLWSERHGLGLSAFDLSEMVTGSPGDALGRCWGVQAGRLIPGALADMVVIEQRTANAWENLVRAREEDVQLVIVDGQARLGTNTLMGAAGVKRTTAVSLGGGHQRRASLAHPDNRQVRWTWSEVLEQIDAVIENPARAMDQGLRALDALAGKTFSEIVPSDPLILELDMPGPGGVRAGPPPNPQDVRVPKPPSLRHDAVWLARVKNKAFHGGLLNRLGQFYQ